MGTQERRERERLEVRQKIMDAARDLFAAHGYTASAILRIVTAV